MDSSHDYDEDQYNRVKNMSLEDIQKESAEIEDTIMSLLIDFTTRVKGRKMFFTRPIVEALLKTYLDVVT